MHSNHRGGAMSDPLTDTGAVLGGGLLGSVIKMQIAEGFIEGCLASLDIRMDMD
jgi:hypothetical protein